MIMKRMLRKWNMALTFPYSFFVLSFLVEWDRCKNSNNVYKQPLLEILKKDCNGSKKQIPTVKRKY
jgi:hypothetical protein